MTSQLILLHLLEIIVTFIFKCKLLIVHLVIIVMAYILHIIEGLI